MREDASRKCRVREPPAERESLLRVLQVSDGLVPLAEGEPQVVEGDCLPDADRPSGATARRGVEILASMLELAHEHPDLTSRGQGAQPRRWARALTSGCSRVPECYHRYGQHGRRPGQGSRRLGCARPHPYAGRVRCATPPPATNVTEWGAEFRADFAGAVIRSKGTAVRIQSDEDCQLRALIRLWENSKDHLWRGLYLLAGFSFFLPFFANYSGFQLLTKPGGWGYLLPVSLALLLFALTFLRQNDDEILQGFSRSWKAALSALSAGIILVLPVLQFLSSRGIRIGQGLGFACWTIAHMANLVGATITFVRARRSPPLRNGREPGQFAALRGANALFALAAVAVSVSIILESKPRSAVDVMALLVIVGFSISICMALYFAVQGLSRGEIWAAWSSRWVLLLLCIGVVVSVLVTGALRAPPEVSSVFTVWLVVTALAGLGGILFGHLPPHSMATWSRRLASRLL